MSSCFIPVWMASINTSLKSAKSIFKKKISANAMNVLNRCRRTEQRKKFKKSKGGKNCRAHLVYLWVKDKKEKDKEDG